MKTHMGDNFYATCQYLLGLKDGLEGQLPFTRIVMLAASACLFSASSALGRELTLRDRECFNIAEPRRQIEKCLAIVDKVELIERAGIYFRISMAYSGLEEWDNAIDFQARGIKSSAASTRP